MAEPQARQPARAAASAPRTESRHLEPRMELALRTSAVTSASSSPRSPAWRCCWPIVLVMNGIYQGNIEDGVWLIDNTATDLWVVERGRGGPFNESSRDPAGQLQERRRDARRGAGQPAGRLHRAARDRRREPAVHDHRLRRLRRRRRPGPPRARAARIAAPHYEMVADRKLGLRARRPVASRHRTTTRWSASPAARSTPAATRWSTSRCPTRRRCSSSRTTGRIAAARRGQPAAAGARRLLARAGGRLLPLLADGDRHTSTPCW